MCQCIPAMVVDMVSMVGGVSLLGGKTHQRDKRWEKKIYKSQLDDNWRESTMFADKRRPAAATGAVWWSLEREAAAEGPEHSLKAC